jgi:hypothetical protein
MVRTMVRREYYGQLRSFFSEVSNFEGSRSKKKKKNGPILERTYFGAGRLQKKRKDIHSVVVPWKKRYDV